jgi:hypothetical protein
MTTVSGAPPSATGRLLDELAGLLLPVVMPLVRRLPAMILVLAGLITLMGVLTLVGAHRDDAQIQAHSAVATAEVLPGSDFSRTLITFTTATGETVSPERGVFYPRGLQPGQIVRVEYDSTHPDRVRVLGRNASVGSLPIGIMLLVTWAVALPVGFSLRGRQLQRMEAARLALAERVLAESAAASGGAAAEPGSSEPSAGHMPAEEHVIAVEQVAAEHALAEQAVAEQVVAEQVAAEQAYAGQVVAEQAVAESASAGPASTDAA